MVFKMKNRIMLLAVCCLSVLGLSSCDKDDVKVTETTTEFVKHNIPETIPYSGGDYTLTLKKDVVVLKSAAPSNTDIVWGYRVKYDDLIKKIEEFDVAAESVPIKIEANDTDKERQVIVEFSSDSLKTWDVIAIAKQDLNPDMLPKNETIVVVGQEYLSDKGFYDAVVWINGKRFAFTNGEHDSFCNAVYTYKDSVFVAACEAVGELVKDEWYGDYNENNGVIYSFKIGEESKFNRVVYSDVKGKSTASGVAYSNGNVYVSSFDTPDGFNRRALYWKNSQKVELTDGSSDALAYCIAADGDDVYVGGYIQDAVNLKEGAAVIWKNGVAQKLTGEGVLAKVTRIVVDGGHVYAAGVYRDQIAETSWQGAIWIDGEMTLFTEPKAVDVAGLYVKDGKWIVNGNMTSDRDIQAYNWYSDGTVENLSPEASTCQGLGVTMLGDDVLSIINGFMGYTDDYDEIWKSYLLRGKSLTPVEMELASPNNYTFWDVKIARY